MRHGTLIREGKRFVFHGKQQVVLEKFETAALKGDEVSVRTRFSLMSTGTENIVFNRLFDPGTHWDKWVKYPFYPGYSAVGVVEKTGENVSRLQAGDQVAYRVGGHSSRAVVPEAQCFAIPKGVPLEQAVWAALAKITFIGARAADYRLGDRVLVIGAGPIGQMSIRWARAAGAAHIYAADLSEGRMSLALAGGASSAITAPIEQAREAVLEAGKGRLPRVVMDSTGNARVFSAALGLAADRGRVVLMGDTGQPAQQVLTSDVIMRGLTVLGAHDGHNDSEWHDASIAELYFRLLADGRFPMEGMNSHTFRPEQCAEAYATANRDRTSTMGILFDWSE